MSESQSADGIDVLEERAVRALTEGMTVLDSVGMVADADGMYKVTTQSGSTYIIDIETGSCECPDANYRNRTCKHQIRVEFEVGEREIPGWIDRDDVDWQLGVHVEDGEPRWSE